MVLHQGSIAMSPVERSDSSPAQPKRLFSDGSPTNAEIADLLYRLAELLELQQEEPFRVRAYRRAAGTIQRWPASVSAMVARGEDLSALPTIGETIAGQLAQICETGSLPGLKEAERRTPPELLSLSKLPGIGPKRLRRLADYLAVHSMEALRQAVQRRLVREVPGLGPRIEEGLRRALATNPEYSNAREAS
jgi:DNA polymerase (family 10)